MNARRVARKMRQGIRDALAIAGALVVFIACAPLENKEAQVEPNTFITATPAPSPEQAAPAPSAETPRAEIIGAREVTLELPAALPQPREQNATLTAFDFLRDYFSNRTYPRILEGKAWDNSSVNVAQLQEARGGVTYWDFWSEFENWDSPFFMWQRDDGVWNPYTTDRIARADGQTANAYVLLDRAGPGVMDKIWFTQNAIWMPQISAQVKHAQEQDELIEWGELSKLGNFRIEVDDRVVFDAPIKDWFSGKALGLTPELMNALTWRHKQFGSNGSLVPVLYQRRLRVLLHSGVYKPKWFMATGIRLPATTRVQSFAGKNDLPIAEMTRLARNVLQPETYNASLDHARAYALRAEPGVPAVIRASGAGTIDALAFRIAKKFDARQLRLKISYGADIGMDLPFVAFFSEHDALSLHRSAPLGVVETQDEYIFYSNYPMPFQNGITLEIAANEKPVGIAARVAASRETANAQLRVLYRAKEKLEVYGPDYRVELPGDGKLVGLVLVTDEQEYDKIPKIFVRANEEDPVRRAWTMGYLEGNLSLRDGAGNARMYGGHEDWADGGFYFNRGYTSPPGGSNRPFGGILRYKDGKDGYATVFRYFNDASAFRFQNGLQMFFGHGTWGNNFPVKYGATVYYYAERK